MTKQSFSFRVLLDVTPNGIRIGLLGAGRIGRIHGANIVAMEGAVLAAIFDPLEGAARALDEILGADDIDAVVIATPTDTHVELIAAASNLIDPEIEAAGDVNSALVILRTASGKLCQISNSRRASDGYDQRIEVHGASGMLRAGNWRATNVESGGAEGYLGDPLLPFVLERYGPA